MINNLLLILCNKKEISSKRGFYNKTIRYGNFNSMKLVFILLILTLLLLMTLSFVNALGVTPGRTTIAFTTNLEKEVTFTVTNTEHKNMNVAFSVEGELKDYIKISEDIAHLNANEDSKTFSYKVKLPKELNPGLNKGEISITQLPEGIDDPGMVISSTVSVVTQVYVNVPYPGKYIDSDINVQNSGGNIVDFYIPVVSMGEEKINNVKAIITIYKGDSKIFTINTNQFSLEKNERKELSAKWDADSDGEYNAVAEIDYDGVIKKIQKKFNVGNETMGVIGVSVNDFKLGQVAKIRVLVQNKMSDDVKNAYASLDVYDSGLKKVTSLKSENYDIPKLSNKEIIIYWDTEKLEKGEYNSEMKIDYVKNFIVKNFKVDVTDNSMKFTGTGFAIAASGGQKLNINSIYYIIIGILVLVNISWLVWWMRNKKKNKAMTK
jgi:hypothetical protein